MRIRTNFGKYLYVWDYFRQVQTLFEPREKTLTDVLSICRFLRFLVVSCIIIINSREAIAAIIGDIVNF